MCLKNETCSTGLEIDERKDLPGCPEILQCRVHERELGCRPPKSCPVPREREAGGIPETPEKWVKVSSGGVILFFSP